MFTLWECDKFTRSLAWKPPVSWMTYWQEFVKYEPSKAERTKTKTRFSELTQMSERAFATFFADALRRLASKAAISSSLHVCFVLFCFALLCVCISINQEKIRTNLNFSEDLWPWELARASLNWKRQHWLDRIFLRGIFPGRLFPVAALPFWSWANRDLM